ncbi:A disintegrin and metalloproteinase with thrombospondin motifs 17 isoform X2 [Lepeophtheirus salmonis]|uniref:A disintegrin and metalloproteinase with thrombospondin motifs 17 isoform X2 n=1 Tax=Lepeophtheirus salmonis TaxID=72036 RepID=UPI003AF3ED96
MLIFGTFATFIFLLSVGHRSVQSYSTKLLYSDNQLNPIYGPPSSVQEKDNYYFIRAVIMADQSMLDHYGDMDKLIQYVLTLMRGVNELYRKGHLGKKLVISLGKVFLSKNIHRIMGEQGNPRENLKSLCKWQKHRTTVKDHHLSVFLTRRNLCNFELFQGNESTCNTLGLAKTWSFCSETESCILNQDIGFNTIQTIAHEIAHTFGISHDEKEENNGSYYIMFPNIKTDVPSILRDFIWSQRSRSQFQKFLMTRSESQCLYTTTPYDDDLISFLEYPYFLPGVSWSGDEQCGFAFNEYIGNSREIVRRCKLGKGICSELWCLFRGRCIRAPVMPLEGTICGYHRWCTRDSCQLMSQYDESEGQWEQWSSWSVCSRDCRAGLSYSRRRCIPSKSGQFCKEGYEDTRHKLCNLHLNNNCLSPDPNYECVKTVWPQRLSVKSSTHNQCLIYCHFLRIDSREEVEREEDLHRTIPVEEGTFCSVAEDAVCIDGDCIPIDCNGNINSNVTKDKCGVCGGDGSNCATKYDEKIIDDIEARLTLVTEFSDQAFNIKINMHLPHQFKHEQRVYLAAAAEQNGFVNILHMYNDIRYSGLYFIRDEYTGKNIQISYKDRDDQNYINSALNISNGFKNKIIRLYVLNPSNIVAKRVTLSWDYNVPMEETQTEIGRSLRLVNEPKRNDISYTCNHMDCGTWWAGEWQECDPETSQETRSVFCLNSERRPQSRDFCDFRVQPEEFKACRSEKFIYSHLETSNWTPGEWSSCSVTCGYGYSIREYVCSRNDSCERASRPSPDQRECISKICELEWWYGSWGSCENGIQRRKVYCFDEIRDSEEDSIKCSSENKPKDYKDC